MTRTNNKLDTHTTPGRESNPGHIAGRRVLSPLHHPCSCSSCHEHGTRKRNLSPRQESKLSPSAYGALRSTTVSIWTNLSATCKCIQVISNATALHVGSTRCLDLNLKQERKRNNTLGIRGSLTARFYVQKLGPAGARQRAARPREKLWPRAP